MGRTARTLQTRHEMFPTTSNMQLRYNIAPTQDVDFVHLDKAGNLEFDRGRWWLVPHFATELPKASMFNARIETIDTSGAAPIPRSRWSIRSNYFAVRSLVHKAEPS